MTSIDVVVVTYNSGAFADRLATSLRTVSDLDRVVIVDNSADDLTVDALGEAAWGELQPDYIRRPDNPGFGEASNVGAAVGSAEYLLLMNPDVALSGGEIESLAAILDAEPDVDVVGAQLVRTDGTPVSSARAFPTVASVLRRRAIEVQHGGRVMQVDWLCGALMLWRRTSFERLGGFDSHYFLYFEDVDICRRLREVGGRALIDGSTTVVHDQGHGEATSDALVRVNRRSRYRYCRRWLGRVGGWASRVATVIESIKPTLRRILGTEGGR